jgi:hypothetical protein
MNGAIALFALLPVKRFQTCNEKIAIYIQSGRKWMRGGKECKKA